MRLYRRERSHGIQFPAVFQGFQRAFRAFQHRNGHAGHAGHMDTETVRRATLLDFAEEQHFPTHFLHGDMIVLHAREKAFQVIEFVVVSGEQGFGALAVLVDEFHDTTGDGHAVIGGSTPANLVQQHQRTGT